MEYIFISFANKGGYPPPCGGESEGQSPPPGGNPEVIANI